MKTTPIPSTKRAKREQIQVYTEKVPKEIQKEQIKMEKNEIIPQPADLHEDLEPEANDKDKGKEKIPIIEQDIFAAPPIMEQNIGKGWEDLIGVCAKLTTKNKVTFLLFFF